MTWQRDYLNPVEGSRLGTSLPLLLSLAEEMESAG